MITFGELGWQFLEQAEQLAAARGFVACPWCATIHPPLAAIDAAYSGFACQAAPRAAYEHDNDRLVTLYERPADWHPLVIYAYVLYSQNNYPITTLCRAAQLDCHQLTFMDAGEGTSVQCAHEEWRMVWRPGTGLFIRHRISEIILSDDQGGMMDRPCCPCCPCEAHTKWYDYDALRQEDFSSAVVTEFQTGQPAPFDIVEEDVLSEAHRRSPTLLVGPVSGCPYCGIDWQAAWNSSSGDGEAGSLHWTVWYFLGSPTSAMDTTNSLLDRSDRANPARPALLGVGTVAALSGMTNDYHN
ncbi:hypothetical protein PG985_004656 [Apiospora marii]|uniref:uncharacterized protein n=1 Tax=Apiospora marii TaxID=335849 RepID=UPI003131883E